MMKWLRDAMGRGEPGVVEAPPGLWAFWPYDQFPFLLRRIS